MRSRLHVDIETFSSVDLPKYGVYRYAESPDFMILMAAWSLDGSDVSVSLSTEEIHNIPGLWDDEVLKVAHNAQFERVCFSRFLGLPPGEYLQPDHWHDTQAVAAELGYPQRLGTLAPALGAGKKDEAGTRLINIFSKPNRKGQRTLPEDKPVEWLDFIDYCDQDVVTLCEIDKKLESLGGWPSESERQIYLADQEVNDRGIRIDVDLAKAAVAEAAVNADINKFEVCEATGWEVLNANSNVQMMKWVAKEELPAANLQAATVARLLEGDLTADQRRVLELRQELALVASKKFASALGAVSPDNRLRGSFKFFGAHTGRWSGRGTQLQNLPREKLENEEIVDQAIQLLLDGGGADSRTLKALVRPMFYVDGVVVDYAAIEARVISWLAGEVWALQAFRDGRDIYVETAERMGGLTRAQGKIAVLALGYNGAINSLKALAGDKEALQNIARPPSVPMPEGEILRGQRDMTSEQIDEGLMVLVRQWRRANPNIVKLWQLLGDAFSETGEAGPLLRVTESSDSLGRSVQIHLPSGRAIGYHGVKWERYKVAHPTQPGRYLSKEGWRYADPKNPYNSNQRIGTYGGRLAENVTQAVARDIMAEAIVRLQNRGHRVVGHVHDEILVEGSNDVDEISSIMSEVPAWADGMPIDGAGFSCGRYRKE